MDTFFPIMLNLRAKPTLVIGGGDIAEGKIRQLLEAEASVHVVAPELTPAIEGWVDSGKVTVERREYQPGDLGGYFAVIAGTDAPAVNAAIWAEARRNQQLVNVVDDPPHCNFIAPSIVRRGDLILAISTAGRSPASAKLIRRRGEVQFGQEWATIVDWLVDADLAGSDDVARQVVSGDVAAAIRAGDLDAARRLISEANGTHEPMTNRQRP